MIEIKLKFLMHLSLLLFLIQPCFQNNVLKEVPFTTIEETLKTNQRAACDGDILHMERPTATKV